MSQQTSPLVSDSFNESYTFIVIAPLSITVGTFLYYVILTQSKTLGQFKYYLLYRAFCAQSFELIFTLAKPIFLSPFLAGFSGGILRGVITYDWFLILSVLGFCTSGTCIVAVSLAVIYRFLFMFNAKYKPVLENKYTFAVIVFCHIFAFTCFWYLIFIERPSQTMAQSMAKNVSNHALDLYIDKPGFYYFNEYNGSTRYAFVATCVALLSATGALLGSIIYATLFVFVYRKTHQGITKTARSLLVCSVVETSLCVIFLNGPTLIIVGVWGWDIPNSANVVNSAALLLSLHGTFDRLSTLYCVVPYRKYCKKLFSCFYKNKIVFKITHSQSVGTAEVRLKRK